jgi:ribulose-5-phosphate 4-epimerase/fuculose-1-phosphate aldolase
MSHISTEATAREEICRVGKSLFDRGYVHATAGNISVRLDNGYLITPTDACLGLLEPNRLARVNLDGEQTSGCPASKTLLLHRKIYAAEPNAHCIIHTHSTHLVALSLQGARSAEEFVPAITPYFVMKVGHIPLIAYHRPGDPRVADLVVDQIREFQSRGLPLRAVMLDRLGPNVWHRTPAQASTVLEELEETARLWLMCNKSPLPLDNASIAELRQWSNPIW